MCKIYSGKNIYKELLNLLGSNQSCVLATIINTKGSTPQIPGSTALFGENGLIAGTVGGGKSEQQIQMIAEMALEKEESLYYNYPKDNQTSGNADEDCGGSMGVLLDANPEKHIKAFKRLLKTGLERIPGVLVTWFSKTNSVIEKLWITENDLKSESIHLSAELNQVIFQMLDDPIENDCRELSIAEKEGNKIVFLETIVPRPHLVIAGAGHVGKALSHLGVLLNFDVTVWDRRKEFANAENLPDVNNILCGDQEESLGKIKMDDSTFLVIVTNEHRMDADVLKAFIKSPATYIGMIGSRNKINQIQKKSLDEKWATMEDWKKVHAPIGIKIHSKTVQEIAVSIAAELVFERNQKIKSRKTKNMENKMSAATIA